ncbi:MAG: hypothetical protein Q7R81_03480 [Candidatus Peregrinibacteria bacterium]|nr:hypothetical protein [Candidatus Peregrinibacteria bacterium]
MQKLLLFLGSLGLLLPSVSLAVGKADLVNSIDGIIAGSVEEFGAPIKSDAPASRKFQTLSNASKTRHDAAMAAIQNIR